MLMHLTAERCRFPANIKQQRAAVAAAEIRSGLLLTSFLALTSKKRFSDRQRAARRSTGALADADRCGGVDAQRTATDGDAAHRYGHCIVAADADSDADSDDSNAAADAPDERRCDWVRHAPRCATMSETILLLQHKLSELGAGRRRRRVPRCGRQEARRDAKLCDAFRREEARRDAQLPVDGTRRHQSAHRVRSDGRAARSRLWRRRVRVDGDSDGDSEQSAPAGELRAHAGAAESVQQRRLDQHGAAQVRRSQARDEAICRVGARNEILKR